jgi:hypothetical protein
MNTFRAPRFLALTLVVVACSDAPADPLRPGGLSLAKGGSTNQTVDFTITDAGMSVVSDGKGTYRNGICGVSGSWSADVLFLAPAGSSVPKSQQAACAGIAPRGASLNLALRHVSSSPHVDVAEAAVGYAIQNIKFGFGAAGATTVNAAGSCGTVGLRFSPITYPGSNDLIREDLGGGRWHMYSRPWPDNVAYCANGSAGAYWHVSVDLSVQVTGS